MYLILAARSLAVLCQCNEALIDEIQMIRPEPIEILN